MHTRANGKEACRLSGDLAQSNAEQEMTDDNFERHQNARISKLEREVAALIQSDAEPELEALVARWKALKDGGGPSAPWDVLQEELLAIISLARKGLTAPPQPDASAVLIEAAEWHEAEAARYAKRARFQIISNFHEGCAQHFRARAGQRNGK